MRYLKYFESNNQLFNSHDARIVLSKIYNIVDEVDLSTMLDFLVDIDDFMKIVDKYGDEYCFASNVFKLSDLKYMTEHEFDFTPRIMIAPFWISRSPNDVLNFEKYTIYSDTIYLLISDSDMPSKEEINEISRRFKTDECDVYHSVKGNAYLRLWWD